MTWTEKLPSLLNADISAYEKIGAAQLQLQLVTWSTQTAGGASHTKQRWLFLQRHQTHCMCTLYKHVCTYVPYLTTKSYHVWNNSSSFVSILLCVLDFCSVCVLATPWRHDPATACNTSKDRRLVSQTTRKEYSRKMRRFCVAYSVDSRYEAWADRLVDQYLALGDCSRCETTADQHRIIESV